MDTKYLDDLIPDIGHFNYRNNTPDWKIEESVTDFIDITYVIGGTAVYFIDKTSYMVSGGDMLCIPKKSLRSADGLSGKPLEFFSTNFQLRNIFGDEARLPLPLICHIGYHADIVAQYKELNSVWLRRDPGHIMMARAHFMFILHHFYELILYKTNTAQFDTRIKTAIRYITDHYAEQITIHDVAAVVELNPVYFGALFKQVTGTSFRQYLTSIRLNNAENMLRSGKHNVNEASRNCGFTDIFYFSKIYKKLKGVPPSSVHKVIAAGDTSI